LTEVSSPPVKKRASISRRAGFCDTAFTGNREEPLHRWVPWIAGFSSSFVNDTLDILGARSRRRTTVLDPFAGVGTTLVEAIKRGYDAVGFEINPYAALACDVKLRCVKFDTDVLRSRIERFSELMAAAAEDESKSPKVSPPEHFRSRVPFFSPRIERQVLFALEFINSQDIDWVTEVFRVALGSVMVGFSNYSYEPSLCTREGAGRQNILDANVGLILRRKLLDMAEDIERLQGEVPAGKRRPVGRLYTQSFLTDAEHIKDASVDILITSPPYLNNYHYVRNTRPHLFWLGFVEKPKNLKRIEHESFGKFWQTVRAGDTVRLGFKYPKLSRVVEEVARQNAEKGVYGGQGWANYVATYFNDCRRFFRVAQRILKPRAPVVIVIGNNIIQSIEVKTDVFLAGIAEQLGYEVVELHRVRKKRTGSSVVNSSVRVGVTKKKTELYETAVELRAPR